MLRYFQHFGLRLDPFLDTTDPQFYLALRTARRNMRRIVTEVDESHGFTVVIGPPGSRKTSLSLVVKQALLSDPSVVTRKILDLRFVSNVEFPLSTARVFGLDLESRSNAALTIALKNFFFGTAVVENKKLVLLIDKAQSLTADGLETLRMLLNFQIPQEKLRHRSAAGRP